MVCVKEAQASIISHGDFRKSVTGEPLPEPRDLSLEIFKDHHRPTVNVTFQFATFAEFLAIDILLSVSPSTDCCSEKNANKPECKPISVRPDDPFYSEFNKTCIDFQRTEQCACNTQQRAQKNGVTSAIDISQVYSPSEKRSKELRTLDGTGQLKHNDSSVGCLLPSGKGPNDLFCPKGEEPQCFMSGDPRTNHHTIATSLLTIYMREHNRIAKVLKQMNPHWGEEKLFQEARKITIAEHQCIVFKDFLPLLLSPRIVEEFNLTVPDGAKGIRYNPNIILGMWNEFAAGSYRLHSLVPTKIGSLNLRFKDTYSNPFLIREGHLSQIIKGAHQVPSEQYDRYMVTDVTDFLYEQPGVHYGQDLASINIQRGRDHGLPPYIQIVKFCSEGAIIISSFDDLYKLGLMSKDNADLLKTTYLAVEDIDMWVGIQLEYHMPGAITGPSAVCINAKQFYFNQKGDRFYFDIEGPGAPFTDDQRSALKQCSFARILCDDTDMSEVTKNPFLLPSKENSAVSCDEIPKIDLTLWKENENSITT
ncbi:peroxidase-like [Argiope bruennichi]|uniref:peroxidase-like n=1 Tax=Argiope bruennichi TaxID=94029 RepID=UPI0024955F8A|nr:peroxidase-like [Argiope bruennichi]